MHEKSQPSISISNRVDTNNTDIKLIIELYSNYLNSSPEIISDNPYWNSTEKAKYKDFDLSRASLFQSFTGEEIQSYYPPFILSVDSVEEKFKIKVLYSSNTNDPKYIGSKVWAIHQLYAVKENEKWVLENSIQNVTANWSIEKTEHIHFIYPPSHHFSKERANKSNEFCHTILKKYNPTALNYQFNYYITNDIDQMGQLENFDYYFVGITKGKSKENLVISANGNEFYPHEFIHQLLPANKQRSHIIEEGLATYLGTKENKEEYRLKMKQLSDDILNDTSVNFHSIFNHKNRYNGYQVAYPAGAAICELIDDLKGDSSLNVLINGNTSTKTDLMGLLTKTLQLSEQEIETKWQQVVVKYSND